MDPYFTPLPIADWRDNLIRLIKDEWMLLTAGTTDKFNTMTANWGTVGYLWNKPIATVFVRPHRYTYGFMENSSYFTLSFFSDEHRTILDFCGTHSGRDVDKVALTGLTPVDTPHGSITFAQARLVLECKKIYTDCIKPENFMLAELAKRNYPKKDFHKFYIGEIVEGYSMQR